MEDTIPVVEVKLRYGYKIIVKESGENPPVGIIIDVYKEENGQDEFVTSFTQWYEK